MNGLRHAQQRVPIMLDQKGSAKMIGKADKSQDATRDAALRASLGLSAREWVREERDWSVIGKIVIEHYRSLVSLEPCVELGGGCCG